MESNFSNPDDKVAWSSGAYSPLQLSGIAAARPRPYIADREDGRIVKPRRNLRRSRFGAMPREKTEWYRIGIYLALWASVCIAILLGYLIVA